MLTMKISRRWILQLLVAGSAIYGILAAAHTEESTKATTLNDQRIHPLADNDVPGVRPLRTTVPSHETSREQVHTATAGSDDVLPTYPSSGNQKALATGNVRGNGNEVKYLLPSTVTTTAAYAPSINATRIASEQADSKETRVASSENPAKDGPEFTTESRGRAMQGNSIGVQGEGNTDTRNSLHDNITDLSDVSMDKDDKDIEGGEYLASRNVSGLNFHADASGPVELSPVQGAEVRCTRGNETYAPGSHVYGNCEERCVCSNDGKITDCRPLTCAPPFFRAGREIGDPLCQENSIPGDPCCVAIVCAQDSETEPEEFCYLGNNTVPRGGTVEDGCSQVCVCEARGKLKCRPRCPSNSTSTSMATMMASSANQPDKCVPVPDPRDTCCTITLCDVTLGDHEIKSDLPSAEPYDNLTKIEAVNSTAMKLFFSNNTTPQNVTIQLSTDNVLWRSEKLREDSIIGGLEPSRNYYVRVIDGAGNRPIATPLQVNLPGLSNAGPATTGIDSKGTETAGVCNHRGTSYKIGAEWYDECISFCTCTGDVQGIGPKTECATIECPTDFGLDVLDPNCLDWESVPADFVPVAPRCCSQEVRCKNNGSCLYQDKMYNNWSQIPTSVTGCDKRCYCDMGNVSCQPACPPVPALPPTNLDCPPTHASLRHLPEDKCCLHWVCGNPSEASLPPTIGLDHALPPGFPIRGRPEIQSSSDQITVQTLEAVAEDRIRLVFTVPRILVGLHGRVEVRYTSEKMNTDPSTWKSQIFTPPDDLIATQQLEFELGDLVPSTEYKVMVTVKLRDLSNSPISKIYSVVTLEAENTDVATLPPQIPTDAELTVAETNSTWANIVWRKFTEYELQFIDGVQLRYKEIAGKVYAATPLIHRAVTSYVLENLKPSATYQVEIYFIPFPGQPNELVSEKSINFTTSSAPDPYAFDINVAIKGIKSTEVEVAWKGVPYPEDKYVNIYRAIYQSDTGKEDTSTFKIAKRDSPAKTTIGELKPGTHYRLWIEVYLTNGRIKKSNVQDFVTKPGIPMSAGVLQQQGKLATQFPLHEGDYYGPLVIVAIVASLAILSTLILLMMLMKRRTSSKADISPRKSTAAYDNPSYKTCENATPSVSCNGHEIETETIR
nr:putative epidermal cell surface receptor isoform X2 [Neodiprion pinetum]